MKTISTYWITELQSSDCGLTSVCLFEKTKSLSIMNP